MKKRISGKPVFGVLVAALSLMATAISATGSLNTITIGEEKVILPTGEAWAGFKNKWYNTVDTSSFSPREQTPEYLNAYFQYVYYYAAKRAHAQGRAHPNDEDVEVALSLLCNMIFWPKCKEEINAVDAARRTAVGELAKAGRLESNPITVKTLFLEGSRPDIVKAVDEQGLSAIAEIRAP